MLPDSLGIIHTLYSKFQ